ncbi:hypothetical protein PV327_010845 [Microctonus hyperodae]|uniref:Uncharacterized protein n=1 Tax=Microctonus hyperodae TaxID=165561 RepID=A0AA39C8I5_MICHY|nr:hypothetical protein PV327_010845 [Microctonus hyperodae]
MSNYGLGNARVRNARPVDRKGRLYPAYSLSGSEGEDNSVGPRGGRAGYSQNNHPVGQSQQNNYNTSQHDQRGNSSQQHPLYHVTGSGAGLSDTPTSGNASDETLTDCELTHLAREWNEFGRQLLLKLIDTPFNDYNAIEGLKSSIKLVSDYSNVASIETVSEILNNSLLQQQHYGHHLDFTTIIERNYNEIFSFLSPLNTYNIGDMEAAIAKVMIDDIPEQSVSLIRKIILSRSIMQQIYDQYQKKPFIHHCQSATSVHHKIIGLFNRAILNLIKGFATLIYISKQSFRYENTMFHIENPHDLIRQYDSSTKGLYNVLKTSVNNLSRDVYRCDPDEHEHEKTFDRLSELVEYYLTSERFLNKNNTCNDVPTEYHGVQHPFYINFHIDESLVCYGSLYECKHINLAHIFLYGNDQIHRRYHAFSVPDKNSPEGEKVYGEIGDATFAYTNEELNAVYEHSPNGSKLISTRDCTIYGCYCDSHDSPRTVRYFSTQLVESDITHHKVITGLQLKIVNRVVYIQIQTGKLVGAGVVDPASVKWEKIQEVDTKINEYSPNAKYVKLNYYKRSLYLDDLSGRKGYYLTGVQFVHAEDGIRIAARVTKHTARYTLDRKYSKTLINNNTNRTELILSNSKIPAHFMKLNFRAISNQNQNYLRFQPSDLEQDAGQTTIPFLDIQPVITNPPVALSGFGIYYRGSAGIAGFAALKLITPEFLQPSKIVDQCPQHREARDAVMLLKVARVALAGTDGGS